MDDSVSEIVNYEQQIFKPKFTIAVLFYGDYPDLARRCLDSIIRLPNPTFWELRIGLNEVSQETYAYVHDVFMTQADRRQRIRTYSARENVGKYPMMRRILYDSGDPVMSPYFMWFDDDSYLTNPESEWLADVEAVLRRTTMCGDLHSTPMLGGQAAWARMQSWYRGKPLNMRDGQAWVERFAVGGWWAIHTKALRTLDWPPKNIHHLGGDYMLGEALRQFGYTLTHYASDVRINDAQRRGITTGLCGIDYNPPLTAVLHEATRDIPPRLLDYPGL